MAVYTCIKLETHCKYCAVMKDASISHVVFQQTSITIQIFLKVVTIHYFRSRCSSISCSPPYCCYHVVYFYWLYSVIKTSIYIVLIYGENRHIGHGNANLILSNTISGLSRTITCNIFSAWVPWKVLAEAAVCVTCKFTHQKLDENSGSVSHKGSNKLQG